MFVFGLWKFLTCGRGEKLEIIIQFQKAGGLNLVSRGLLDDDDYYDIGEDLSFITQKKGPFSYSLSHNFLGILLLLQPAQLNRTFKWWCGGEEGKTRP